MNIGKSSLKLFAANATGALSNFTGVVVFNRILGGSLVGSFFLFEAVLGLLSIPSNFGIRDGVEKRISEGTDQGSYLSAALLLKFIPLVGIASLVVVFRGYLNDYIGQDFALMLVGVLFLREYAQLSLSVLRAELRVGETAALKMVRQVSWLLIGVGFLYLDFGVESLVGGLAVGYGLMFVGGWYRVSTRPARPSLSHARSLFDYSKFSFVSSVGGYFYSWMDIVIIGLFLTQAHVNAYEVSWRVTMVVMLFSRALATTIFPQVSRWDTEEAIERIENLLPTVLLYSLLFVVPAFFGVLVLSDEILQLVFQIELPGVGIVLVVLMGEKILQAIHVVIGRSLQAIDRPDLAALATLATISVNLVLNVVLVWQFGLVGAAVATTVSFLVNTALHWHYLRQFLRIKIPFWQLGWIIASSAGMGIVLMILKSSLNISSISWLFAVIAAGVLVYLGIVLVSPSIRNDLFQKFLSLS
ncbi:polysaccharide biosynthesis protein [Halorhabdus utahensis DSM 12940]|uniref:Polysaccharide biosynthesis protein n=1 Tax=Halorhabdus utahensis (strain DSM 12940 / JCM 11049 / AX-2) TaxID=519442 RepID=C7NU59_HALUD|nr:polysaccharide biosynthesis C-terminal domain-containing protein [Halorhabdus utahensis]ACV12304.1 polysaccharide biosynthesis protein [Halorhabdus utahensis DSM 12940]